MEAAATATASPSTASRAVRRLLCTGLRRRRPPPPTGEPAPRTSTEIGFPSTSPLAPTIRGSESVPGGAQPQAVPAWYATRSRRKCRTGCRGSSSPCRHRVGSGRSGRARSPATSPVPSCPPSAPRATIPSSTPGAPRRTPPFRGTPTTSAGLAPDAPPTTSAGGTRRSPLRAVTAGRWGTGQPRQRGRGCPGGGDSARSQRLPTRSVVEAGTRRGTEPKVVCEPKVGIEPMAYALPRRCSKKGRFQIQDVAPRGKIASRRCRKSERLATRLFWSV